MGLKFPKLYGDLGDVVAKNAFFDSNYSPYCMRCSGLIRMVKIEDFFWACKCGAKCDLRVYETEELSVTWDDKSKSFKPSSDKDLTILEMLRLEDPSCRYGYKEEFKIEDMDDLTMAVGEYDLTLCSIEGPDDENN